MSRKPLWITSIAAGLGLAALSLPAAAHDEPVVGVLGGAGAGALIAGPPGAVAGAIIGAIAGAAVAHDNDHGHRHARHVHAGIPVKRVRYVEADHGLPARRVQYVETEHVRANGATYYNCEPNKVYYRERAVTREAHPKAVKVAAKPKLKKVCRYVPVGQPVRTAAGGAIPRS